MLSFQDISNVDGERLRTLCQTIIEEGPLVFNPVPEENKNKKYQEEVPVYVKRWTTLKEISMVLNANLQEIVDRWYTKSFIYGSFDTSYTDISCL